MAASLYYKKYRENKLNATTLKENAQSFHLRKTNSIR